MDESLWSKKTHRSYHNWNMYGGCFRATTFHFQAKRWKQILITWSWIYIFKYRGDFYTLSFIVLLLCCVVKSAVSLSNLTLILHWWWKSAKSKKMCSKNNIGKMQSSWQQDQENLDSGEEEEERSLYMYLQWFPLCKISRIWRNSCVRLFVCTLRASV